MSCRILHSAADAIPVEPVDPAQVVDGQPAAGVVEFAVAGMDCGLWQHTAGISTDVEADEVFVVISGRARIEVEGGPTLDVGPGDVVHLEAGAKTSWTVAETLRKFWVVPG
ncbi:MAG: cupin domain-containing protein [Candidatus Nanopelagicales bacterium]